MEKIASHLEAWLGEIYKKLMEINFMNDIYYKNTGFFASNNILDVIQYNLKKYYNKTYVINKEIDLTDLNFQINISEDVEIYEKLSSYLKDIITKFNELFNKSIIDEKEIIISLINNCKCFYLYTFIFDRIISQILRINKNNISNQINKTF